MIKSNDYKDITMRKVNFNYIKQAYALLISNGKYLSSRRLRRLAYLDVHQNSYKLYLLYMDYKKIMNSDAANNQTIAIVIVVGLMVAAAVFLAT